MGIKGLAKLLSDEAPESIQEVALSSLHGRKIAIDASMAIYQFLIAVRHSNPNSSAQLLTNADGETTSHVQGIFNRTIRFLSEGIRPVYVFDGKPPNIKSHELVKRRERREKAQEALKNAIEDDNMEEKTKQEKRLVRAGMKENNDCKKLLGLMGVPVVEAPCEAEAQAAELAKKGKVWAVGTEDMDALTFETPVLLRKMTFASASKSDVQQISYEKAITGLNLTREQFVDLCIMLGCDYCDSIRNVGPKTALKLIRQYSNIETILKNIDREKYGVPDSWVPEEVRERKKKEEKERKEKEEYDTDKEEEKTNEKKMKKKKKREEEEEGEKEEEKVTEEEKENVKVKEGGKEEEKVKKEEEKQEEKEEEEEEEKKITNKLKEEEKDTDTEELVPIYVQARHLFNQHEVHTDLTLKWTPCQPAELTKYLVEDMGFNADRVKSSIEKLQKSFKATAKPQTRMDSFFKPKPGIRAVAGVKRKTGGKDGKGAKKGKKGGAGSFGKKRR